jgi:dihydroflavonol-4-reductase
MILASTSGTIAVSEDEAILDEREGPQESIAAKWPYYASKIYQERLAFDLGAKLGLDVISLNPSLLLGPGDRRLSSTGDVLKFLRRQIPSVPKGGVNFVDARDAAIAFANALTAGTPGERYLLGGPNWTTEEFFGRLARVSKVRGPWLKLPGKLQTLGRGGDGGGLPLARQGAAGRSHLGRRWPSTTGGSTRPRPSASWASARAIRS